MASASLKYYSIKITRFLMSIMGFWSAETKKERVILDIILSYMIFIISFALAIEVLDFYYSWGNLYAFTYTACSTVPLIMILIKLSIFVLRRKELTDIIKYNEDNFWYKEYDVFGRSVLEKVEYKGRILVCAFTFFVQGTVTTYMLAPIVENLGKNETDRILPFTVWVDIPSTTTPYFEVLFVMETLALVQAGVAFCSFDNFLGVLCMHAAAQFKILQHRLETIFDGTYLNNSKQPLNLLSNVEEVSNKFMKCVEEHRTLIKYVQRLESMFSFAILFQLFVSSVLLCVAGFQVFVGTGTLIRRSIFFAHVTGCFFQIFIVTISTNEVIVESRAVGDAAYNCGWESAPYKNYKDLRKGVIIMILRASHPCYITAGGFSPVSLETFMGVLSTAASYFTLLRNIEEQ